MTGLPKAPSAPRIAEVLRQYWGFDALRPLQEEAILAAQEGRDSLVVLPTGGGKSLCYQVPPALDGATDIVVSPLISLMKDQVDGLLAAGYPAAALHGGQSAAERRDAEAGALAGEYRLVFVSPERVVTDWFAGFARRIGVKRFAIDEAHCISQWGHDFRPEYRQLVGLRDRFPAATLHAFTATATPRVRADIAAQLALRNPALLVGCFDRPNLVYRVTPAENRDEQIVEVVRRHRGEATIIYCISRNDTEQTAALLIRAGIRAAHYHAGMTPAERHRTQDAFADERLDVVAATVAFGMGIDRSNVRCVLHTSLPKSVEHYQQETGRAGRDGLEAECVLLYSYADLMRWESLIQKSAREMEEPEAFVAGQKELLRHMQRIAAAPACRHRLLSEYFGQTYAPENCGACDFCLGEIDKFPDSNVMAQKILSCVARTEQRFGVGHVVDVLTGANTEAIRRVGHQQLSTYGLLKATPKKELQALVYQLVDQGVLERSTGDRPTLVLNERSWEVMRGKRDVHFAKAKSSAPAKTKFEQRSWEGVDRELFDRLRTWRRGVAEERGVPPFVILHDSTLLEIARARPGSIDRLREIRGFGERRIADLGPGIVAEVAAHCRERGQATDVAPANPTPSAKTLAPDFVPFGAAASAKTMSKNTSKKRGAEAKSQAFALFAQGAAIESTMAQVGRARSTIVQYLAEFIATERPLTLDPWVPEEVNRRVLAAHDQLRATLPPEESGRLSPLFAALDGEVPYDTLRLVLTHARSGSLEME